LIAVVGGGVIGLSVGYYLSRAGAEVVLCERGSLGRGCTWGSAGWISPSELRELEPTLSRRAEAGYLIGRERHIDPARLTAGLAGLARKSGAEIWEQAEMRRLDITGRRVRALVTSNGPLPVASVILAAGASCGTLLRPLGIRLPLTAGKGYSFLRRLRTLPGRPVHLGDIKVAVTPFARGLRIAGTMELSGNNETLRRSRAQAIARGTAQYFDG